MAEKLLMLGIAAGDEVAGQRLVLVRAAGGEADGAGLQGLFRQPGHGFDVLGRRMLAGDGALAHDIDPQRVVGDLRRNIDGARQPREGVEVIGEALPVPFEAFGQRDAAAFTAVAVPSASTTTTPGADRLQHRLHQPPPLLQLLVLPGQAGAAVLDLLLAAGQPLRHAVEGGDERRELVVAGGEVHAHAALAGGDALRAFRHQAQRRRDAAGEIQGEPDRAEEDEQGREEVEREIDRLDRLLEGSPPSVLRVALLDLAGLGRDAAREEGGDDARRPARRRRGSRTGTATRTSSPAAERGRWPRPRGRPAPPAPALARRPRALATAAAGPRRRAARRRAVKTFTMSIRSSRARTSTVRRSRPWPAGVEQPPRLDLARQRPGVDAAALEDARVRSAVPRACERGQDALDVHVEPAVHRLLDEVAAHDHQQQRRRDRHQEEDEDEPHAEARAQHAAAPLHHHAHEVAPQDEEQHQQQR